MLLTLLFSVTGALHSRKKRSFSMLAPSQPQGVLLRPDRQNQISPCPTRCYFTPVLWSPALLDSLTAVCNFIHSMPIHYSLTHLLFPSEFCPPLSLIFFPFSIPPFHRRHDVWMCCCVSTNEQEILTLPDTVPAEILPSSVNSSVQYPLKCFLSQIRYK